MTRPGSSKRGPGKHRPPGDLSGVSLPLTEVDTVWFRSHLRRYGALFFGRSGDCRFDAPGQEYGVLYVADNLEGAFIETFGIRSKATVRHVTMRQLRDRRFAEISFPRPLRLVDLTGPGLARVGADARLCAGGDYAVAQLWSLAFWQHTDQPDGILYLSRHDPSTRCAAIFDRAGSGPGGGPSESDIGSLTEPRHRILLASLLNRYGFSLVN